MESLTYNDTTDISARRLGPRHLGELVHVQTEGSERRVIGILEKFSMQHFDTSADHPELVVKIRVSGIKYELRGSDVIQLLDGDPGKD